MWSFYFVILDFLNEQLPWRNCKDSKVDEVRDIKASCFRDPEHLLWRTTTASLPEIRDIFLYLMKLDYADQPDYDFIRQQLGSLLQKEEAKEQLTSTRCSSAVPIPLKG